MLHGVKLQNHTVNMEPEFWALCGRAHKQVFVNEINLRDHQIAAIGVFLPGEWDGKLKENPKNIMLFCHI